MKKNTISRFVCGMLAATGLAMLTACSHFPANSPANVMPFEVMRIYLFCDAL